jgi:hypothetical protein
MESMVRVTDLFYRFVFLQTGINKYHFRLVWTATDRERTILKSYDEIPLAFYDEDCIER